jgi:hypothetical protein
MSKDKEIIIIDYDLWSFIFGVLLGVVLGWVISSIYTYNLYGLV